MPPQCINRKSMTHLSLFIGGVFFLRLILKKEIDLKHRMIINLECYLMHEKNRG